MNRIKALRTEAGMTQSELGKLLNVKDAAISKYENEKIPLTAETLIKLKEIFGVSVDYILGSSENKENAIAQQNNTSTAEPQIVRDIAAIKEYCAELSVDNIELVLEYVKMLKKMEAKKGDKNG